jgi:hypothetical protein
MAKSPPGKPMTMTSEQHDALMESERIRREKESQMPMTRGQGRTVIRLLVFMIVFPIVVGLLYIVTR